MNIEQKLNLQRSVLVVQKQRIEEKIQLIDNVHETYRRIMKDGT